MDPSSRSRRGKREEGYTFSLRQESDQKIPLRDLKIPLDFPKELLYNKIKHKQQPK